MSFSVIRFPGHQSPTQEIPFFCSIFSPIGNSDMPIPADEHNAYTQHPHVQGNDSQMPNAFAQFTQAQAGHVALVEDGRVELFIHFFRNDKYIGARYYLFDGTLMREDLFIKKLDDYTLPPSGTSYRCKP